MEFNPKFLQLPVSRNGKNSVKNPESGSLSGSAPKPIFASGKIHRSKNHKTLTTAFSANGNIYFKKFKKYRLKIPVSALCSGSSPKSNHPAKNNQNSSTTC